MQKIRVHLTFSDRLNRSVAVGAMVLAGAPELGSETVTQATYYPAPSGVYTRMMTTAGTVLARDPGTGLAVGNAAAPAGAIKMVIMDGSVGIGTLNAESALQVAGGIQLEDDPSFCTAAKAGTQRWHLGQVELCDGTLPWRVAVSSAGALTQNNCYLTGWYRAFDATSMMMCNPGYYMAGQQQIDCTNWSDCERHYCCQ